MTDKKRIQHFFIIGVIITALAIVASIITAMIILVPSMLLAFAGLPWWPIVLLALPIGFILLGWSVLMIGRFKRGK